jgi:hypothetical protein
MCLTERQINDYLNKTMKRAERRSTEDHLSSCDSCLNKVVFAYDTVREFKKLDQGGSKMNFKKHVWLISALITFTLSFIVSRFFIQLLVATILLAAKWIFDSVNARILITIYEAWRKGGEREASRILKYLEK